MAEPEGLVIEGARLAAAAARDLWRRGAPPAERARLPLARIRQRLELFLAAFYADPPAILPADPPPAPVWLARLLGRAPRHLARYTAAAATDGVRIWLPRDLDAAEGESGAVAMYRLLAVEQAARVTRGTAAGTPRARADPLERDLYCLAEAVAIDRTLAEDFPGLLTDLRAARRAAIYVRPSPARLTPLERHVEALLHETLSADPASPAATVPVMPTPAASRVWAHNTARDLLTADGLYRGIAPVALWGDVTNAPVAGGAGESTTEADTGPPPPRARRATLRHRPATREAGDDEDDESPGMFMVRLDDPMESVEDPMGLQRPADQDTSAAPEDLADSLSELPEARVVRTPGTPPEVLDSDAGAVRRVPTRAAAVADTGIVYPEWDYRTAAYRTSGAVVWPATAPAGEDHWADVVMARHAALVRRVRRRFDGLRPRHVPLSRQRDGSDLDLSSYVTAFADRRAGQSGDDRLYMAERRSRRDLAITLLIDMSASTDAWVAGASRIIDVEKEALIVLLEALDALGDRHAVLGFSGHGPAHVRLLTIKAFEERTSDEVRRRIAAVEPDGYTRAGAAIRHASAMLGRHGARQRLLLILSDGKPNDVDQYEGRYGVEDTRQAVAEARLQGLVPFCLTVDRHAAAYVPSIFGPSGYTLLHRPELLPQVLVEVVRKLVTA